MMRKNNNVYIRNYKFRMYPTEEQDEILYRMLMENAEIYNAALESRKDRYKKQGKTLWYKEQFPMIKDVREDFISPSSSNYRMLRRLDDGYKAAFRRIRNGEKAGFPKYKSKKRRLKSFTTQNGCIYRENKNRLEFSKCKITIRVRQHRPLPENGKVKMYTIYREARMKWYMILHIEFPKTDTIHHSTEIVGIDVGITKFATLSNGESIENPRFYENLEKELRVAQRTMGRRQPKPFQKSSKRYLRAKAEVAKIHGKIKRRREDFLHKISNEISNGYRIVVVENLNIDGMKEGNLGKQISDVGWAKFITFLEYKLKEKGGELIKVDPKYTSQDCSVCGYRDAKNRNGSNFKCLACGECLDADLNAAINIRNKGIRERFGDAKAGRC